MGALKMDGENMDITKEEFILKLILNCGYDVNDAIDYANKVYGE